MIKLFAIPMICSVMSGPVMKDVSYHHEYGPQQAVVYDDNAYQITFSVDELNNYTWENLSNYFLDNDDSVVTNFGGSYLSYNSNSYNFYDWDATSLMYQNEIGNINLYVNDVSDEHLYKFVYYVYTNEGADEVETAFAYDIVWDLPSVQYADIKTAIQADIQANQTSSMPSIQDLFAQVTSAINAFIGSLGDAFTQVTALFWDSTAATPGPTFLGLLVLIGVGVGLVYAAYRVIKGLLHRI